MPSPYGTKQLMRKGKKRDHIVPLRSLLGVDTLQFNNLRILYDPAKAEGYLETQ